jgi:undecaprenyl-diphosphatase
MSKKEFDRNSKIILYLILFISFFMFVYLLLSTNPNTSNSIVDKNLNFIMQNSRSEFITSLSKTVSTIFEPAIFIILLFLVSGYLFFKKRKKESTSLIILTALTFALGQLIKVLVQRPRPINSIISETGFSFPSSHALMAVIFFGILIYFFEHHISSKMIKQSLILFVTLIVLFIGLSRAYLNVHWFSDVLAGFFLGIFLLVLYILIISRTNIINTRTNPRKKT